MLTILTNATIFTGQEKIAGKALVIEDDKIKAIVDKEKLPEHAELIDCDENFIAPGLIDLQIYGGGGFLFSNDPSVHALDAMSDGLMATGTTGFLITVATNSDEIFRKAIQIVKENPRPAVIGLHLEGPFINPEKRGAHIPGYIKRPEIAEIRELLELAEGVIKMVTLAPEMCDPAVIKLLTEHNVVVSAGHSNATFEEAQSGYENGITTTTHLFNAMSSLHHRSTGLPGAAYLSKKAFASIIPDGIHVDFNTLMISKRIMKERLFLITDAVEACDEGAYIHVRRKDRFTLPDGTLSGSCITLLQGIKNCVEHAGISLEESLRMASTYPAKVIGANELGKIDAGFTANLTIFSDKFEPVYTIINGKIMNK
jgi:N-acetylglucosamine-6-phosphate deacetylase